MKGVLPPAIKERIEVTMQRYENETFDVIVIGSGYAGLAAAIEAKKRGASTLVLEKGKGRGGNSAISGGYIAAARTDFQKKSGIDDSPELMAEDMLKSGQGLNYPDLVKKVSQLSGETINWTIKVLGVEYQERVEQFGGHSVPRTLMIKSDSPFHFGADLVHRLMEKVRKEGIEVRTKAEVKKIVQNEDFRVNGVMVEQNSSSAEGRTVLKYIRARRGVVIASGGFANDVAFRTSQDPRLTDAVETTNRRTATAEMIVEALRIGAMPVHLSAIQLGPWATPDEKGSNVGANFSTISIFPHGIVVDPQTGLRLLNERANRKLRADAILATGHPCIGIVDAKGAGYGHHFIETCLRRNVVRTFDSLDQLADYYKIPSDKLSGTVSRFNDFIKKRFDPEFGRPFGKEESPIEQPPYHAIRLWPKIHFTSGGIRIDTEARVIDIDHQPIRGMFAAGEVAGGVHGASRLGSCAITDCLVFGRIAGKSAAESSDTDEPQTPKIYTSELPETA